MSLEMFDGIQNNATGDAYYFTLILFYLDVTPNRRCTIHTKAKKMTTLLLWLFSSLIKKPKRFSTKPEREQAAFVVAIIQSYELTGR